jgi:carbamate kinase
MGKRIVVALGGNALGTTLPEQMTATRVTARAIVDLIEEGHEVIVAHGNGPQVGMIQNAMTELNRSNPQKYIPCPLSVCVAMSQGYIGYDLQNALREEMLRRGISKGVATVLTQVEVDPADPAFTHPTKPIGAFMTRGEAEKMVAERDYQVIEDAGRGWRRVVASPKPQSIVELGTISALVETDHVVIACGGGGIPVFKTEGFHLKGAAAVIDKDFAACKLAEQLNADCLIIMTAVEKVAIHFGRPDVRWLDTLTPAEAKTYIAAGEFAPGSMLPKVEAAVEFAESGAGRTALITLLEKAREGIAGKTGTWITDPAAPPVPAAGKQ